jgi:hypothetical protein
VRRKVFSCASNEVVFLIFYFRSFRKISFFQRSDISDIFPVIHTHHQSRQRNETNLIELFGRVRSMAPRSADRGGNSTFTRLSFLLLLLAASVWLPSCSHAAAFLHQSALLPHKNKNNAPRPTTQQPLAMGVLSDQDERTRQAAKTNKEPSAPPTTTSPQPLLDWNASGSIGSLLMQMQRKEVELRRLKRNESATLLEEDQAVDLSAASTSYSRENSTTTTTTTTTASTVRKQEQTPKEQWEISKMKKEAAKELDDAVQVMSQTDRMALADIRVLEMPSLYKVFPTTTTETSTQSEQPQQPPQHLDLPTMPLSQPEHYRDRIGRDMRHLAVSIASSVENIAQWRFFCQQQQSGGLVPLLECIREGAKNIRENNSAETATILFSESPLHTQYEESFLAASSACRALRDLCAISPELSAVITDDLLRANAAYSEETTLMTDFCTLLQYANEHAEFDSKNKAATFSISGRRNRRGEFYFCSENKSCYYISTN